MTARSRPSGRLRKRDRVRKRREYQAIQQSGQRLRLQHYIFVLQVRDDSSGARLGITASRKVGCAVVRNRAKRLVREAFRQCRDLFPRDVDVVVIVRDAPERQSLADVVEEWRAVGRSLNARVAQARRERALQASVREPPRTPDAGPASGEQC